MPLFAQTEAKIYSDVMKDILNHTNISRTSPGSKMRALVEAIARKQGRMWSQFDLNMTQAFIDGAEGKFLSYIGDMYGVTRLGEEPASVSPIDRLVRYYVDVGTFGDINSSSGILIPTGTIISTQDGGKGILYKVVLSTVLAAGDTEAYIACQSVRGGTVANVGAKVLLYHDFTDYSDSTNNSLKVINDAEILRGQDPETDTNYRYRIVHQITALEKANWTAIRIAAMVIPGVADVVMLPWHKGVGSFTLLIKSTTPSISNGLIETVDEAVDKVIAKGINAQIRGPVEIGISITGTIILKKRISAQDESNLIQALTDNVTEYINSLDIGEDFVIREVVERVMASSDLIKTIGTSAKPFDKLYIYKPSRLEDNKIRATLLKDYSPKTNERVIVENQYAGATPVLFRIAE